MERLTFQNISKNLKKKLNADNRKNLGKKVIDDFGNEWSQFDQSELEERELKDNFSQYFNIFPLEELDKSKEGFDLGCGSGRWAKLIAPKIKTLLLLIIIFIRLIFLTVMN